MGVAPDGLEQGLAAGELWWHSFPEDRARPLAANQNWSVEGKPTGGESGCDRRRSQCGDRAAVGKGRDLGAFCPTCH
jgi:hypothetical protein